MGQAAGTAAHLALAQDLAPSDIDVKALQKTLEATGVFLGMKP